MGLNRIEQPSSHAACTRLMGAQLLNKRRFPSHTILKASESKWTSKVPPTPPGLGQGLSLSLLLLRRLVYLFLFVAPPFYFVSLCLVCIKDRMNIFLLEAGIGWGSLWNGNREYTRVILQVYLPGGITINSLSAFQCTVKIWKVEPGHSTLYCIMAWKAST